MNTDSLKKSLFAFSFVIVFTVSSSAQMVNDSLSLLQIPTELNKARFNFAVGGASVTYAAFSYGLYNAWYKQFETESFHLFNDWGEWENMDKYGHLYSSYFQGVLVYEGARWTGLNKKQSILTGIISATLFQTTIEVMDGFSSEWGFSLTDMAANAVGISAFALQQAHWDEQRIRFKVSSWPKRYSEEAFFSTNGLMTSNLENRADMLFGSKFSERFLKDYNAQTIWASVNVKSFLPDDHPWPNWLNMAVGYSAENMFGGYENDWTIDNSRFLLNEDQDRYLQFVISPDIDLTRLGVKNRFVKSILGVFNIFKLPMPGMSLNTRGEFQLHFLYLN